MWMYEVAVSNFRSSLMRARIDCWVACGTCAVPCAPSLIRM